MTERDVFSLQTKGSDLNGSVKKMDEQMSSFLSKFWAGDADDVRFFLMLREPDFVKKAVNMDVPKSGERVLTRAVLSANIDMAKALIESGADVNYQDQYGRTALFRACEPLRGERDMKDGIRVLIENGADVNLANINGITPLHLAADGSGLYEQESVEIIDCLIKAGANVNAVDCEGHRPIDYTIDTMKLVTGGYRNKAICLMDKLVQNGADFPLSKEEFPRILSEAISKRDMNLFNLCLKHPDKDFLKNVINDKDDTGRALLHKICDIPFRSQVSTDLKIIQDLIAHGADVMLKDNAGEGPLHKALNTKGQDAPEIAEFLIKAGARLDDVDFSGETPVHELIKGLKEGQRSTKKKYRCNKDSHLLFILGKHGVPLKGYVSDLETSFQNLQKEEQQKRERALSKLHKKTPKSFIGKLVDLCRHGRGW